MSDYFCTVFTPTYNRADYLKRLYNSLINQTFKNFEWLIVDDGSTDNTREVVNGFIEEKRISINYYKTDNGGKHRAINYGLDKAQGKVFAIVDSDDYLELDALDKIKSCVDSIQLVRDRKYAGVAFNRGYDKNRIIGSTFDGEYIDVKNNERKMYNILGDKFEIYYTDIFKKYKFPVFEGEKFMSEIVVWTRIAKDGYYLRWYNEVLYIGEYLNGGLTDNNDALLRNNPKGYALRIVEQVKYGNISFKEKMGYYSNYYKNRKDIDNISTIAKDLETNSFIIIFSYFLRKIIELTRKIREQ